MSDVVSSTTIASAKKGLGRPKNRNRLRAVVTVFALVILMVAAYGLADALVDDTSFPARWMEGKKSQQTLLSDCQSERRIACYVLARSIDQKYLSSPAATKSQYSAADARLLKFAYGKACDDGYEIACAVLAYEYQLPRALNDLPKSLEYSEKACQLGDQHYCLGAKWLKANGTDMPCYEAMAVLNETPPNYAQAEALAITLLDREACIWVMGRVSKHRLDYVAARTFFETGAAARDPYATLELGNLYEAGQGTDRNKELALKLYRKALAEMNGTKYGGTDDDLVAAIQKDIKHLEKHT